MRQRRRGQLPGSIMHMTDPFQIARLMQLQKRLAWNLDFSIDGPAPAPGSCYAAPPPILEHTRTSWRSRTISRHASKGSWRENRVSRRSSSAEVLAPQQLTPPRRLNLPRMRRWERPALASRAGHETLSQRLSRRWRNFSVERRILSRPRRRGSSRREETASSWHLSFKILL